ncbi:MAG TPA: FAD-dependent oxidoreductase [Candidatus Omnitrophota bacterium]|nr:FAD-dependent oxidoreductase [Candidatus Omnitrophota bacterium]HPT39488.1 FAD-dependent oxidoreductase [Candidatus Omnitrophota bacterium]
MKKIVIIGAGFAGLSAARRLSRCGLPVEITLFDKKGEFNFLPLLPNCLGCLINPDFLVNQVAGFCRKLKIKFNQEEIVSVDLAAREVKSGKASYDYDYLVIASGSQTNFFANSAAQAYGYSLNSVADIQSILARLRENNFENLVICGAGFTGIEAAANLWLYLKKKRLSKKIIIVERAPDILSALPGWIREYVSENLKDLGIEVLTNSMIENIQADKLEISGGKIFQQAMLIWVPGVRTADFIQKLKIAKNPQGRIIVDEYLGAGSNCFCAGDAAAFGKNSIFLRMAVQFAITQGHQAAGNIIRSLKNLPLKKYCPQDLGYIIPMVNNRSCGQVLGWNVSGFLATFLHFTMCIFRSLGWKNRRGLMSDLLKGGGKC